MLALRCQPIRFQTPKPFTIELRLPCAAVCVQRLAGLEHLRRNLQRAGHEGQAPHGQEHHGIIAATLKPPLSHLERTGRVRAAELPKGGLEAIILSLLQGAPKDRFRRGVRTGALKSLGVGSLHGNPALHRLR